LIPFIIFWRNILLWISITPGYQGHKQKQMPQRYISSDLGMINSVIKTMYSANVWVLQTCGFPRCKLCQTRKIMFVMSFPMSIFICISSMFTPSLFVLSFP
jgi:hypothetical protein